MTRWDAHGDEAPAPSGASTEPGETIRVVAERTGLSMDVLRAWERRFGFPKPERRPGSNRRLYSRADVARLVAIQGALGRGYRIGDVIAKSLRDLEALAVAPLGMRTPARRPLDPLDPLDLLAREGEGVARLLDLLVRDDVSAVEGELRRAAAALGPRRFVTDVAHPFAIAVGEAWAGGALSIRHEHVATECLTTRLRQLLDAYQDVESRPRVMLATLPGEWHTLPLQMVALYVAVRGAKPRLLGGPTPAVDIVDAARMFDADVVGLTVTLASDRTETLRALRSIARALPSGVRLWVGGGGASSLEVEADTALTLTSWGVLEDALARWRPAPRGA